MYALFEDVMDPGVELMPVEGHLIPDYLPCDSFVRIALDDRLDPTALPARTGILYEDNLYLTDGEGNVAFIDCHLRPVSPTAPIRAGHPEYRKAGGRRAFHKNMDAGHFGLALGQHPSIAMEQDRTTNRYGAWRIFERYCAELLDEGRGSASSACSSRGTTRGRTPRSGASTRRSMASPPSSTCSPTTTSSDVGVQVMATIGGRCKDSALIS